MYITIFVVTKKLIVDIDDKLDNDFRNVVFKKYGFHQGVIKKALVEAIQEWIVKNK